MCWELCIARRDKKHSSAPPLLCQCNFMVRCFVHLLNKLSAAKEQEEVSPRRSSIFRRKIAKSEYKLRYVCHSAWNNWTATGRILVTICTAQWSLYVPHSGQYMYRSGQYMYRTVVNICTAQWSIYVPHSGQYMYRTVVAICTAQWSIYVPHSGQYMYRTVVNICTTQWSI